MDNLLIAGLAIGGLLLLNNRENYTPIEDKHFTPTQSSTKLLEEEEEEVDLLDLKSRTFEDLKYSHFIPNIKQHTQPMGGTGLNSDYNIGGDLSQLMSRRDAGKGFGDDTYMSKKVSGPRFEPEKDMTWINGSLDIRPELDRYNMNMLHKNKEQPFESVRVGPGISTDPTIPACGGFNSGLYNRVNPDNIFNYKVNQLPGKIIQGKQINELPTSKPNLAKNSNAKFWESERLCPAPRGRQGFDSSYYQPNYQESRKINSVVTFGDN